MRFRAIIDRWTTREHSSLGQLSHGKTLGERFRGLRRSERNEAKLLLLAMFPSLVTMPFLEKWSDETIVGRSVIIVTGLWMLGMLAVGVFLRVRVTGAAHKRIK
jgi:hypothetical protein